MRARTALGQKPLEIFVEHGAEARQRARDRKLYRVAQGAPHEPAVNEQSLELCAQGRPIFTPESELGRQAVHVIRLVTKSSSWYFINDSPLSLS